MVFIEKSWGVLLKNEFEKQYFKDLVSFLKSEYKKHTVFPKYSSIFAAFNLCSFNNLKVVILGQDPYPGEKQANGLCFSVDRGIAIPKSLQNIFKEVKEEFGFEMGYTRSFIVKYYFNSKSTSARITF